MRRALAKIAFLGLLALQPAGAGEGSLSLMHGFIDQSSMTLWLQAGRATRIVVEVHPDDAPAQRRRFEGVTRVEDDFALQVRLAGLEPGTRYRYRVLVDGKVPADSGAFTTQPLWQFRDGPPEFAVAVGSCAYLNDRFSRPGPPWGGDYGIFDQIAAKAPEFMLWMGDNVYFREPEWTSLEGMSARYRAYREAPALRKLLRATARSR